MRGPCRVAIGEVELLRVTSLSIDHPHILRAVPQAFVRVIHSIPFRLGFRAGFHADQSPMIVYATYRSLKEEQDMKTFVQLSGAFVVAGALAGLPAPAIAGALQSRAEVTSIVVVYKDLNLSRPEGAKTLYKRIEVAARKVCGFHDGRRPQEELKAQTACYEKAVVNAVKSVNQPQLAALHESRRPANSSRRA